MPTDLADRAHERASVLLRRWLSETHTPVAAGPLRLRLGPVRLSTEVVHHSRTGSHGFGPIHVTDDAGRAVAVADPTLVAAACAADAQARAVPEAPVNASAAGSLVDWVLWSLTAETTDPAAPDSDLLAMAAAITDHGEAERWLSRHVESRLVPALRTLDRGNRDEATAKLLSRRALVVIGLLGRRGVADEVELLDVLKRGLRAVVETYPETGWLVEHWLTSPTLTDLAVLNGSDLRYRSDSGELSPRPVQHEVPNPLYDAAPEVPGVPLPQLGQGWSLRPVEVGAEAEGGADVALVHRWMHEPHVAVNWNQAWSVQRWHKELAAQLDGRHSVPCLVSLDGEQVAYVELYRVLRDKIAGCYSYDPHDLGVHIAIGAADRIGRGVGSALLSAVAEGLFEADPQCRRVVAEPNVHNAASIAAFRRAGFVRDREIGLPGKNSALMVRPRR